MYRQNVDNFLEVTVDVNGPETYVCRARNSAGADAGIVGFRTGMCTLYYL